MKKVRKWFVDNFVILPIGMCILTLLVFTVVLSGPAMWVYLGILLIMGVLGYWLSVSNFHRIYSSPIIMQGYYDYKPPQKRLLKATAILALPFGPIHVIGGLVILFNGNKGNFDLGFLGDRVEVEVTYLLGGIIFFVLNIWYLRKLFSKE